MEPQNVNKKLIRIVDRYSRISKAQNLPSEARVLFDTADSSARRCAVFVYIEYVFTAAKGTSKIESNNAVYWRFLCR